MLLFLEEDHLVICHRHLLPLVKDTLQKLTNKSTATFLCDTAGKDNIHSSFFSCSPEYFLIIDVVCRQSARFTIPLTARRTGQSLHLLATLK